MSVAMGIQNTLAGHIGWPLLWLVLAMGLLVGVVSQCGCSPPLTPCSPTDVEGEAMLQLCESRIQSECDADGAGGEGPVRDASCKPLQECIRWAEARCEAAP